LANMRQWAAHGARSQSRECLFIGMLKGGRHNFRHVKLTCIWAPWAP
jgi:hypothetical protein